MANPYRSKGGNQSRPAQNLRKAVKMGVAVLVFAIVFIAQDWAMTKPEETLSKSGKKRTRAAKYVEPAETVNVRGRGGAKAMEVAKDGEASDETAERESYDDDERDDERDDESDDGNDDGEHDQDGDDDDEKDDDDEEEDEDDDDDENDDEKNDDDDNENDVEVDKDGENVGGGANDDEGNDAEDKNDNDADDDEEGDKKVDNNEDEVANGDDDDKEEKQDKVEDTDDVDKIKAAAAAVIEKGEEQDVTDSRKMEDEGIKDDKSKDESNGDGIMTMSSWRDSTLETCQKIIDAKDKEASLSDEAMLDQKEKLEKEAVGSIKTPDPSQLEAGDSSRPKYTSCKYAFIDLGTNIGDSVGYFVDSALDVCTPLWVEANKPSETKLDKKFPRPHLDLASNTIIHRGHEANPLYGLLQKYTNGGKDIRFEDTCVYGMEGNPVFTERLQKLENLVLSMEPRPVKHLHIHTESVIMGKDGPTKLYLDKTTPQFNFWGSSVVSSATDVIATADKNGGELVAADVEGVSLTTLVKNTMMPFQVEEKDEDKSGGLLIIKMDVEGAEYQVIKDIAESNVLCDYIGTDKRNKVVMIVEWHGKSIKDKEQLELERRGNDESKRKLLACGVKFENLNSNWA